MAIHSPACAALLAELRTAPPDSVDFRISSVVARLPESRARGFLLTVIDEDPGTHAAELARAIWQRAADPITSEEQQ